MIWDDIRYFIAVVEHGNLSRGAQVLGISSATLARRIMQLEESLGAPLFSKTVRGYELTERGLALLPLARETSEKMRYIERHAFERDGELAGKVNITCPDLMATHFLLPRLAALRAKHADLYFEINNSVTSVRLATIQSDLVIRLSMPTEGEYTARRIGRLERGLFCASSYANSAGIPATSEALSQHALIGWGEEFQHIAIAKWFASVTRNVAPAFRLNSMQAQLQAVMTGAGIAALPAYIARPLGLIPVLEEVICNHADIWILRNKKTFGSASVDLLYSSITESITAELPTRD